MIIKAAITHLNGWTLVYISLITFKGSEGTLKLYHTVIWTE